MSDEGVEQVRRVMRGLGSVVLGALAWTGVAGAQVAPAVTEPVGLSVFAGPTGTFTGLRPPGGGAQSKNLGVTAGLDLDLPRYWKLRPTAELRGTYPEHAGHLVGEKNLLAGVRNTWYPRVFAPIRGSVFADILVGWGRLAYVGGYPSPDGTYLYLHTSSFVYSPGVGGTVRLSAHWALQGDAQLQHYDTPVSTGSIWGKAVTGAVVYRIDRGHNRSPWSDEP